MAAGAGGAAAAGSIAGALIKAKSDKKKRIADARRELGQAEERAGEKKAGAIKSILDNFRATLVG